MRWHFSSIALTKFKQNPEEDSQRFRERGGADSCIAGRRVNWGNGFGKQFGNVRSLKI